MFLTQLFARFLNSFDQGRVLMPSGVYEWFIATPSRPLDVWISQADAGNLAVCQGAHNMYGFSVRDDGFVLYADIKGDHAEVLWQVRLG